MELLFFCYRDAGNIKVGLEHLVSSNFLLNICIIFDICIPNEHFWMSFEYLELRKSTISQRVSLLLLYEGTYIFIYLRFQGILIFLNYFFFWCRDEIEWAIILGLMTALIINKKLFGVGFLAYPDLKTTNLCFEKHIQILLAQIWHFNNLKSLKEVHSIVLTMPLYYELCSHLYSI